MSKPCMAAVGLILALFASPGLATVLTFDILPQPANNDPIDQNYGDRVTAAVMGGFSYGIAGGFTPNVVASYGPTGPGPTDYVYFWDQDFGDLTNVIAQFSGSANYGIILLTLTADPGFVVMLDAFDLAGWNRSDRTINSVQVQDGLGNTLFSQNNVLVLGAGPAHTSFAGLNLSAATLVIRIDASNLPGGNGLNVGIDNIRFSQNIPEPATTILLGSALSLLYVIKRAKTAR